MGLDNRIPNKKQELDESITRLVKRSSKLDTSDDIETIKHELLVLSEMVKTGLLHIEALEILKKIENIGS